MDATLQIDYLSISTPATAWGSPPEGEYNIHEYYKSAAFNALSAYPSFCHHSATGIQTVSGGGYGYKHRLFFAFGSWTILYGAAHGRLLIQLPGESCGLLRLDTDAEGLSIGLSPLLLPPASRITRVDIAATFKDGISTDALAALFKKKNPSDYTRIASETGVTQYIGNRASERFLRVYRFAPPHPRSDWIRIEFELKGHHAARAQEQIPKVGLQPIMKSLLDDWGFAGGDYVNSIISATDSQSLTYASRQRAGGVRWLMGTALPAVKKAIHEGQLLRSEVNAYLDNE